VFGRLCEHHRPTGNDIPDAWIAAAVPAHHDHLVSFDKAFRRFLKANEVPLLQP
jgi:predicted nucleic acid-binding protein